ncbi:MAG: sigma-70 family RNA polymerase sigma factor [Endomicrobiales bacterium]|nr:sigma-70 family RNA polymerase sigma factor [Endomicrobiales bacterium]
MAALDPVQLYFREIKNIPSIPKEEMPKLWVKALKGDKRVQKKLVEANLRLVIPIAKRYFRRGLDFLDLIEEGNMGLIRAVEKFDIRKKVHFSTYATYWIDQAVRRAIEEQGKTIRIPPHVWDALNKWLKFWGPMQEKLGREPTTPEMAKAMKLSVQQVESLMRAAKVSQGASSLEAPIDEEGNLLVKDIIADKKSSTPESISEILRQHADIDFALNYITDRERAIIKLRFGIGGNPPESLELVGKKLKLSRERVRQLEERAIKRLKSVALRIKLISSEDAKKMLADERVGPLERRQVSDRREGPPDRRIGLPDTRVVKIERRARKTDRRAAKRDRRSGKDRRK